MSTNTGTYLEQFPAEARVVRSAFYTAFAALGIGAFMGLLQVFNRLDIFRIYEVSEHFSAGDYYSMLTLHAVLLVLTFAIFFLVGVFTWAVTTSLDRGFEDIRFTWAWFGLMSLGTLLAGVAVVGGLIPGVEMSAAVLYTFYAPLQAHPLFYLGLALFIVGTWLAGVDWFRSYLAWRAENPDERIPLPTFMTLTTTLFWYLSSVGVAVSVLVFLLPWSLGIIEQVNALLTRTLFWYFGHAVVYFWLMPAYLLWYVMLPKVSGGKLFSDPLARVVFILFLILSTPTGIHHQYLDPGIAEGFKFIAMVNTMFLLLPSLLTAFTVVASMEHGARQRGGSGYFGWLRALPWRDPVFTGMALAGLMFAAAGFSGMINAGMNINYLVHNTWWVVGHFHLTIGTAVTLTFMAVTYWFLPQLTGRKIWSTSVGLAQVLIWFLGMALMSNAMHRQGLLGVPRRTAEPEYRGFDYGGAVGSMGELNVQIALGGTLLFVSTLLFLIVVVMTVLGDPADGLPVNEYAETLSGPEDSPLVLDNLKLWAGIAALLVILAYALPLASIISRGGVFGPGGQPSPALVETITVTGRAILETATGVVR